MLLCTPFCYKKIVIMHHQLGSYILSKAWVVRKKEWKIKLQNRLEGTGGHIYPTAELHLAVDVMLHCISLRFCYSFNNSLTTDKIRPIIYCLINYAKNYAIIKLNVHMYFSEHLWAVIVSTILSPFPPVLPCICIPSFIDFVPDFCLLNLLNLHTHEHVWVVQVKFKLYVTWPKFY